MPHLLLKKVIFNNMGSERLQQIRELLDKDELVEPITVRTLLSWFGYAKRGLWVVKYIRKVLEELELKTVPDFNEVWLGYEIKFEKIQSKNDVLSNGQKDHRKNQPENIVNKSTDEVLNIDDPTYRIGRLEAANKDLVYVKPDADLSVAITHMMTHDFSQIPVMQQDKRGLKGVISWRSIGSKLCVNKDISKVKDLMEPNYQLLSDDTSLFKALPIIIEHEYVLVENRNKEICGIVTASDLSLQFKQLSEPFLLVAEVENHIRQIISKLSEEDIANAKDEKDIEREVNGVADLTFGEYVRLCQNPQKWSKLDLPIDRAVFAAQLERIREVRNNIMHFDPDGLEPESIELLRNFVRLLQTLKTLKAF